jgi:PKD repeat protein
VVAIMVSVTLPTSGWVLAETRLRPAAAATSSAGFTVGVVGDQGGNAGSAEVLRAVGLDRPNIFLSLGDLSYDQLSEPAWCQFVKDNLNLGAGLTVGNTWGETYPFEIAVGNHEAANLANFLTPTCLPDRLGAVPAPGHSYGRQYYVDYPAAQPLARFIVADPGIGGAYTNGSPQLAWMSGTIDQARAVGIPWVIAVNHENYITAGVNANAIGSDYFNLLVNKRVDLILQGHDHTYQRSKQLAQSAGCPLVPTGTANPLCIADDGADASYVAGTGSVLLIDGTGGASSDAVDAADPEAPYFAVATGANTTTRGFTRLTFTPDAMQANFVRSGGGAFADAFQIARVPDVAPPTAPSSLSAQATSSSRVDLAWSAATDDRGIAGYQIVRDGMFLPDVVTSLSASVSGLSPGTTYTFTVQAIDFGGNIGPASPAASATTLVAASTLFVDQWNTSDGSPWQSTAWTTLSSQGVVDVAANTGRLQFNDQTGANARAALTGVAPVADSDLVFSYQWNSSAPRAYFNVYLRGRGGWQNSYRPLNGYGVAIQNDSSTVTLARNVGGTVTTLRSVSGGQQVGTARQWVRFRVSGSQIQVRLWADGQLEPATWNATVTDSMVSVAGQVFLSLNRSSSNSVAKAITLDDLVLSAPTGPTNQQPVALISTPTCTGLICNFDGRGSTDPDGSVQSYAWTFGDGGTSTGVSPSHSYASGGTYSVRLTVTDDASGTGTATTSVTVALAGGSVGFVGGAISNRNALTHSVAVPAGVSPGDTLLLFDTINNTTATASTPSGLTGWTLVDTATSNGLRTRLWRRQTQAGDASATVTVSVSVASMVALQLLAYSGAQSPNPLTANASAVETVSRAGHTTPVLDGVPSGARLVSYWADKSVATSSWTPPAGQTVRGQSAGTSAGHVSHLVTDSVTGSGATGGLTATANSADSRATMWSVVLAPS